MMRVLCCGRTVPLRYPTGIHTRRFPGWLKLNLGERIAGYARFAAAAKTVADGPERAGAVEKVARARLTTHEANR
jgi:hypothetical protein